MKIVGLICWYDENPAHLAGTVASMADCVDSIVAVDGAYALYPQGARNSPTGQAEAIRETARGLGMGCVIHEPQHPWLGNEVEKRNFMFRLGEQVTEPDDWYLVMDGDGLVTHCGYDLHARCEATERDVGEVTMWKYRKHYEPHERPFHSDRREEQTIRIMFRAIRGLAVVGKHYVYVTPDGRYLWGDGRESMEPAEDFTDLLVEHRNLARDPVRNAARDKYYDYRDKTNVEGLRP